MRRVTNILVTVCGLPLLSACGLGLCTDYCRSLAQKPFFNKATGFDSGVFVVSKIGSRIYVGGKFQTFSDQVAAGIIAFKSDGTVDTTFNAGTGFNDTVRAVVAAPDATGDIYVAGDFTTFQGVSRSRIARLNADGSLDTGFNPGTGASGTTYAIATLATGEIYLVGSFATYNGVASSCIVKILPSGLRDTSFTSKFAGSFIRGVGVATDGSGDVLIGGDFWDYDGNPSSHFARIDSAGDYIPITTGADASSEVHTLVMANDGTNDFYLGGTFSDYDGTAATGLVRMNNDGTVDQGYAAGVIYSLAVVPGGDVYAVYSSYCPRRFNADGSTDTAFTCSGLVIDTSPYSGGPDIYALAVDGTDLLIGGTILGYRGTAARHLLKVTETGDLHPSFNVGAGFGGVVRNISPAIDGSGIYVQGFFSDFSGTALKGFTKLGIDGLPDPAFQIGSGPSAYPLAIETALDGSGDVYLGGSFTSFNGTTANHVVRINSNGSVDTAFSTGAGFTGAVAVLAAALDGSGDVYVGGGFTQYQGVSAPGLIRLNSDGSRDTAFNIGTGFAGGGVSRIGIDPTTGDVYVGGNFLTSQGSTAVRLIRLNSDGSADAAFATGAGLVSNVYLVRPANDGTGDVFVGHAISGTATYKGVPCPNFLRLRPDGSINASFNIGTGPDSAITDFAYDGSGRLYIVGFFLTFNGVSKRVIARLWADGSLDTTFEPGFINGGVDAIERDSDGDFYLSGAFTSYEGVTTGGVIRIDPNGQLN